MIIAIDTEELEKLVEYSNPFNDINYVNYMLLYSAKRIHNYYNSNQKDFVELGCLRNPVIIEDENFIQHLNKRKMK